MTGDSFTTLEEHRDFPDIVVVICYLSLFSIAGSIGNAFVLYVFSRKRDKSTTTVFILSLAGTDLFTCLVIIPFTIYYEILSKKINNDLVCKIYQFLITCNVPFSAFIMVVIAFDRYFKICRPWNHVLDVYLARRIIITLLLFAMTLGVITAMTHGVILESNVNNTSADTIMEGDLLNKSQSSENVSARLNHSISTLINFLPTLDETSLSAGISSDVSLNDSQTTSQGINEIGYCKASSDIFSPEFVLAYQKCHVFLFLISFLLVVILYSLILRTICLRRNQRTQRALLNGKERRTSENLHTTHTCTVTTRLTVSENGEVEMSSRGSRKPMSEYQRKRKDRNKSIRDKQRLANIKTAGILFIVTAVFIVAFLPAWLMAVKVLQPNIIIFYMYYSYNVANPIIYAFFNITFRKEMREVLNCR
ncbi:hypothetical protein FSP39_013073 [Pinctada imbricata]|uniref:G-protein coupled receptors family 1 profile domain-containing protein n=1 Tax=Pinctada imbricata TaxID=66713 RepID=A0AA88YNM5_PINIB|nr:hypothetical protein FSP39_013073 [Pinctada imbricata]